MNRSFCSAFCRQRSRSILRRFARGSLAWIGIASALFYLWAEPIFFIIALVSTILDFALGGQIARGGTRGRIALTIGVVTNLSLLIIFKYTSFLVGDVANPALSFLGTAPLSIPEIALPIGISFIVFEKITYLVDIHRGVSPPAANFQKYLLYVFFFPKLLAGPIIKYHELEPQIRTRPVLDASLVALGFERFAVGVVKKVLIADPASLVSDQIFSTPVHMLSAADAWTGALFFTAQIYFDFSGYSDMAIGIAMMLGFRLRENFNFPYVSVGITEFWRRWHISLSTWIKEYLYIPLGGSRVSTGRTYLNLVIAFLASGIWHGANWTFVAWGVYHGLFLVIERMFLGSWLRKWPVVIGVVATFIVVVHGWVLFRANSIGHAGAFLAKMYDLGNPALSVYVPVQTAVVTLVMLLASTTSRLWLTEGLLALVKRNGVRLVLRVLLAGLFVFALGKILTQPFQPFLYFRF